MKWKIGDVCYYAWMAADPFVKVEYLNYVAVRIVSLDEANDLACVEWGWRDPTGMFQLPTFPLQYKPISGFLTKEQLEQKMKAG